MSNKHELLKEVGSAAPRRQAKAYRTSSRRQAKAYRTLDQMWRVWLPAILLVVVAAVQILLAKTAQLSPWKGGGFGMFATTDGTAFRFVRIFVEAPGRSEELELAPSQEIAAARAQLFPSDKMLRGLAQVVVARERRYGRPIETVRLEVWRTEFSPVTLEARDRPLQSFVMHVDQSFDHAR